MAPPRTAIVRHSLLALLSEGPKYGLQLREEFEAATGHVRPLNSGQVYTTLDRLQRAGLIERESSEKRGRQRQCRITSQGTSELTRWMSTLGNLALPTGDESVLKVLIALLGSQDEGLEVIRLHRRYLVEAEQRWTCLQAETGTGLHLGLGIDAVLAQLQWRVRWLNAAEGHRTRSA
jgi:DNA-binding PadR family transcriptional regulator